MNFFREIIFTMENTKCKQTCFFCFTCIVIVRLCFIDLGEQLCPRLLNFFELILHIFLFFEGHHGLKKVFFKKSFICRYLQHTCDISIPTFLQHHLLFTLPNLGCRLTESNNKIADQKYPISFGYSTQLPS